MALAALPAAGDVSVAQTPRTSVSWPGPVLASVDAAESGQAWLEAAALARAVPPFQVPVTGGSGQRTLCWLHSRKFLPWLNEPQRKEEEGALLRFSGHTAPR